jgi:hypothetical protein
MVIAKRNVILRGSYGEWPVMECRKCRMDCGLVLQLVGCQWAQTRGLSLPFPGFSPGPKLGTFVYLTNLGPGLNPGKGLFVRSYRVICV